MRLFLSVSAAAVLAIVVLAACNSNEGKNSVASNTGKTATPATPSSTVITPPSDGVRRVTTAELRDAVEKGTAAIVDVRPAQSYQQSHIKGAIHIPVEQFPARVGEVPRDKFVVTYCS